MTPELPDLKRRHTVVLGKKKEGKSNWVQYALTRPENSRHLVYDTVREHQNLNRYIPTNRKGDKGKSEFNGVTERFITEQDRDRRPHIYAVEEASRVAPNRGSIPDAWMELVDLNRHYDVGLMAVARRPAQMDTDTVELADTLVVFYVDGKNDVRRLNEIKDGLGDRANDLDPYHYLTVQGRELEEHQPVPEMDTTGEL